MGDIRVSVDKVMLLAKLHQVAEGKAHAGTDYCAKDDLIEPEVKEPVPDGDPHIRLVYHEIEGDEEKREGCAIVASALRREQVAYMCRNVLVRPFPSYNRRCENRIRRRETRSDREA